MSYNEEIDEIEIQDYGLNYSGKNSEYPPSKYPFSLRFEASNRDIEDRIVDYFEESNPDKAILEDEGYNSLNHRDTYTAYFDSVDSVRKVMNEAFRGNKLTYLFTEKPMPISTLLSKFSEIANDLERSK